MKLSRIHVVGSLLVSAAACSSDSGSGIAMSALSKDAIPIHLFHASIEPMARSARKSRIWDGLTPYPGMAMKRSVKFSDSTDCANQP